MKEHAREYRAAFLCDLWASLCSLYYKAAIILFAFLFLSTTSACGNKCEEIRKNRKPNVDIAKTGSIKGKVIFKGTPPKPAPLNTGISACDHGHNAKDENVIINDGKVQNVFIYIKDGLESYVFPIPDTPVIIDQKKCLFKPRVAGAQICQDIVFKNSDEVEHDVNSKFFNMKLLGSATRKEHVHEKSTMLNITCQLHGWMRAYIGVLDHPCFSVSGPDGTFEIPSVPAGKYKIEAWHELLSVRTKDIEIKAQEKATLPDFEYESN